MRDIDLGQYHFTGLPGVNVENLSAIDPVDAGQMLMAGVDVEEAGRAGTYLHIDQSGSHCRSKVPGVEILDIKQALAKYDGLPNHFWKLINPDKDKYTVSAAENLHGGYFIKTAPGAKIAEPVQSCLFIKTDGTGQNVHNVIIVEDGSELHVITGCSVAHGSKGAAHLGISEFYVGKNARLTFTMIHNWAETSVVRPRSAGVVAAGGVYLNNYVLLKTVRDLQMYPSIDLAGDGAVARFNSVMVAPPGSYADTGSKILLSAQNTRGEMIARTIASGGTIVARGFIGGRAAPAKGHLECRGLILGGGTIHAIPELEATVDGVELSHEAAVGKIARREIEYLMARGLTEDEATSTIVRGFLNVDIMGLPQKLKDVIDTTIAETEKDMF